MTFIHQTKNYNNKILLVNGFNGTGKTILPPILDAFSTTFIPSFAYELEWFSNLFAMGVLSRSAFEESINKLINYRIYNQLLGREVNTRFHDLSSIFKSKKFFRYLKSIFTKDDIYLFKSSPQIDHTLVLTITQALDSFPAFSNILSDRLLFIEFMRDPLFMYLQTLILHRSVILGDSSKDFTFRYSNTNFPLPPFMANSESLPNLKTLDEFLIHYFTTILDKWEMALSNEFDISFMPLPFELFVLHPEPFIKSISSFITSSPNYPASVARALLKQSVPRELLTSMSNVPIYKRYGFKRIKSHSLIDERQRYKVYLRDECNIQANVLEQLSIFSDRYFNLLKSSVHFNHMSPVITSLYAS